MSRVFNIYTSRELPFQDLEKRINLYRTEIQSIIEEKYAQYSGKVDLGSEYVQRQIYDEFCKRISEGELREFKSTFDIALVHRDQALKEYVPIVLDEIEGWKGNENLVHAYFLMVDARDKKTNIVKKRIVPIPSYYQEKHITNLIKEQPLEYLPEIKRPSEEIAKAEDIEILSISNLVGFYDPKKRIREYTIESLLETCKDIAIFRIKNSMRERKKLIDWMLGLRPKEDYPYDATGALVAVSDTNKDGKEDGMQIYSLRDFIVKRCRQYGKIIQENLRTKVENSKSKIQKLAIEKYDSENYRTVMRQSRDLSRKLERKKRHKDKLELDYEQMSVLRKIFFQGPKIEHYFNDTRTETIIMNKEMYKNYSGEYIGHTSTYIAWRDQERELYLNNPALSEARKKERLRAEKKNIKKHQKTDRPAPEPSLAIIAKLLEDRLNIIFESP